MQNPPFGSIIGIAKKKRAAASTQPEKDSNLWLFLHSIHGRTESFQAAPDSFSGSRHYFAKWRMGFI
jgi:hypothetical protein